TLVYRWEADLLSVTKSWLTHEFEIKLSAYDYAADMKKPKHDTLLRVFNSGHDSRWAPNYFWYVVHGFEPAELPPYAGLLRVERGEQLGGGWLADRMVVDEKVGAPRLHRGKMPDWARLD